MDKLEKKLHDDIKVLTGFVGIYCRGKHGTRKGALCPDCSELLAYAHQKRRKCPLDPKPACKHCPIHCYAKEQRNRMREVMGYSGKRLLLKGRLDLLWHYFF
ncbi:nitrous oxide-stimulated promoter family protein [Geomesophilobacter sediminis]|uniref:Nitrous oxide-stimulated promoter family protein n=1 Tax=Geomesophilobacter sediminis TaxID=2798584 RepID=A0A8J7LWP4_9BACT|nr:nitrous oxide-stimulated promoter family protein [Geomesophilobacter sediminis]MBJ6726070.1 nitrous oxide-stimulated promoter family protein [Geomesophilobacter sediminis]